MLVIKQRRKLEMMQIEVQKKDILRLKEEAGIPSGKPNIREILWENIQLPQLPGGTAPGEAFSAGKIIYVRFVSWGR